MNPKTISDFPNLLKEWDWDENKNLDPYAITSHSNLKVSWICSKGHRWKSVIASRTTGCGCPYCSNKKVLVGYNDLASTHNSVLNEWDWDKNTMLPTEITAGSNKKAWFICSKGHSYETKVYLKVLKNHQCPYCSNQRLLRGYNDLATTHPEIAKEWDFEKNNDMPDNYMAGSDAKKWFKCDLGHSYYTRIYVRKNGNGCPYCGNQKVLKGFNDLATLYPEIAAEWDYERNKNKPNDEIAGSTHKAYFICPKGHKYRAVIQNRTRLKTGCSRCSSSNQTSFFEQAILFYLSKTNKVSNRKVIEKYEFDIFLDDYNIAIEYDGFRYHDNSRKTVLDSQKTSFANQNGIILYRIRDHKKYDKIEYDKKNNTFHYQYQNGKYENFEIVLKMLLFLISEKHGVPVIDSFNIDDDFSSIKANYSVVIKSFAEAYPSLTAEWDYEKNLPLTPDTVSYGSRLKVWWRCKKGHEYKMFISNKAKGRGCPICSNRIILPGYNDLATLNPSLANEWNYVRNGSLLPAQVSVGSSRKVWWLCNRCKYEWQNSIVNRNKGSGCPNCAKEKRCHSRAIKVAQLDMNGKKLHEFYGISDAARKTGISQGLISAVCSGKRKQAGGYIWVKMDQNK